LEGIIGPWHLDIALDELRAADAPINYVVLRPELETCLSRAKDREGDERVSGHPALTEEQPIRQMWRAFADLGDYEHHAIDTTLDSAGDAARKVADLLSTGTAVVNR
jgi:hypothetical protein